MEFASQGTWKYAYLSDCQTEQAIPISLVTTCTFEMTSLAEAPLFLRSDDIVRARVWALNVETGLKAPSDGWDCQPSDGKGSVVFIGERSSYYGDVKDCLPEEGGQATIVTSKGHVFEGEVMDQGRTRIGTYRIKSQDGQKCCVYLAGTFTGDGLTGWYTVSYPSGLECTEAWSGGRRTDSIGEEGCREKVDGKGKVNEG